MSGFKAITVNTSPEVEPHIYAEDDAAIFQTIFGKDGVSTIGQQCEATVISNNKVRVADGVICVGGHFGRIPYGEYVDCEIQNGKTGVNRNDIIVAKFETTGTGGIDTFACEVIQGTAGSAAADPEITENDLYSGGTVREFPLYRVKLEGLSIVSVDKLFNIIPTNAELLKKVNQLNSDFIMYVDWAAVSVSVNGSSPVWVNAPSKNGYNFVCWVHVSSHGFIGSPYFENPTETTTSIWDANAGTGTYYCVALYRKF